MSYWSLDITERGVAFTLYWGCSQEVSDPSQDDGEIGVGRGDWMRAGQPIWWKGSKKTNSEVSGKGKSGKTTRWRVRTKTSVRGVTKWNGVRSFQVNSGNQIQKGKKGLGNGVSRGDSVRLVGGDPEPRSPSDPGSHAQCGMKNRSCGITASRVRSSHAGVGEAMWMSEFGGAEEKPTSVPSVGR